MALEMIVVEDFGKYPVGSHITDPATIEALRANPAMKNRVQLVIMPDPEPVEELAPAAPVAPTEPTSAPEAEASPAPKA